MPPYTTSAAGFSATSGSRLFCNMRNGASVSHDLQLSSGPRGARMVRLLSKRLSSLRVDMGDDSCERSRDYRIGVRAPCPAAPLQEASGRGAGPASSLQPFDLLRACRLRHVAATAVERDV